MKRQARCQKVFFKGFLQRFSSIRQPQMAAAFRRDPRGVPSADGFVNPRLKR
jgi:hypothetical protein